MCGICGQVNADPQQPVRPELHEHMNGAMIHRGPDSDGFYLQGNVGLGMRRLAIIDLVGGDKPISNEDGTVWIVFNGEIYNHQQLRSQLTAKGHQFRTSSDTEAIVHLYEDYGSECVKQLRGICAFALWDSTKGRLLLARDRTGQKPLYT